MNRCSKERQKGAAVVEFALLSGLLLIFLFGIFEFGFLWMQSNYIANAAREGARVAAKARSADVDAREDAAEQAVENYLHSFSLFANRMDNTGDYPDFLTTSYTRDPEKVATVVVNGETLDIDMAEVTVTVKTHMVWEPVLWPLLSALIPGVDYDENFLRELSYTAAYAIE